MKHLDEGMVHAWLDDALPASEAREIATHVQSCALCTALVAEARGFVAASTRIVAQLDHVSANVNPANSATKAQRRQQNRRAWWQHPGVAAAAVLGVSTMSWIALHDKQTVVAPAAAPVVAPVAAVTTPMAAAPARSTPTRTATPAPTQRSVAAIADRVVGRAEAIAVPMSAPVPLTMRARGANTLAASEREETTTSLVGCYVVSRARGDDAKSAGSPLAELPSNIQLTDSVAVSAGATSIFVAYGRPGIGATAQSLRWRAISSNAFALTRTADPDAPVVRVTVDAFTASAYGARRTTCP